MQGVLPKNSRLSQYINEENCHCIRFPIEPLQELERHIVKIVSQKRWGETIPKEWAFFEIELSQIKGSRRILKVQNIVTKAQKETREEDVQHSTEDPSTTKDMLRYYHDAGKALYFDDKLIRNHVVIDVQWFIDAFKHIITDKLHSKGIPASKEDWNEYYMTGNLKDQLLKQIWKHKDDELKKEGKNLNGGGDDDDDDDDNDDDDNDDDADGDDDDDDDSDGDDKRFYCQHKKSLLLFMERLGLVARGNKSRSHYVPCMNRQNVDQCSLKWIQESKNKSPVLIYKFDFLPYFLYFRLVVACMQEMEVKKEEERSCLYKDVALFLSDGYVVVISVTAESIQLQIVHSTPGCSLEKTKTNNIQDMIEGLLKDLTGTFHRKISFEKGLRCRDDDTKTIPMDIHGHFLQSKQIPKSDPVVQNCPLHLTKGQHSINTRELTEYWKL